MRKSVEVVLEKKAKQAAETRSFCKKKAKGVFGFAVSITHNFVFITHNSKMVGPITKNLFGTIITLFLSCNSLIFVTKWASVLFGQIN